MTQQPARFEGFVREGGLLSITDLSNWSGALRAFAGSRVWIMIEPWRKTRSNPQNRWYRGVIVPAVAGFLSIGRELPISGDQAHEYLKLAFNGVEKLPGGVLIGKSTKELTTAEFSDYCERIRAHAATEWGLNIPGPNDNWMEP